MSESADMQMTAYGPRNRYGQASFAVGCNSGMFPARLTDGQYVWGINGVNRGGVFQTRMDHKFLLTIPAGNLQGHTLFRPTLSHDVYAVVAVDGKIYVSAPPYITWHQLPNLQFRKDAPMIYWKRVIKTADLQPDGSIFLTAPKRILIMQDSGYTRAGMWDGTVNRHYDPTNVPGAKEVPLGGPMEWIGDRLWVLYEDQVLASDIQDPEHFSEIGYFSEGQPFQLPDIGTALAATPDQRTLLAFTANTTTSFQASIRDRTSWKTTVDFQRLIFPNIGCMAHRSVINQYGLLWWYSTGGFVNLNTAMQTYRDAQIIFTDHEMARSKGALSPILREMAGVSFENYLLMSVPSGDVHNSETWVLDQSVESALQPATTQTMAAVAWNGIWTGTRPVEWATEILDGAPICTHASRSIFSYQDSTNHLWMSFGNNREDNNNPILVSIETRWHTDGPDRKSPRYAEFYFTELADDVVIEAFWRGTRGEYIPFLKKSIIATQGPLGTQFLPLLDDVTLIQDLRPQSRYVVSMQIPETIGDQPVESPDTATRDRAFSMLIRWTGRAALMGYQLVVDPNTEKGQGIVEVDETDEERMVFVDGRSEILELTP